MAIKINDDYCIECEDRLNVVLYKIGIVENPESKNYLKPYKRVVGYYPTMNVALKALVKEEIHGTGLKNLESVVNKINEVHELIDSKF